MRMKVWGEISGERHLVGKLAEDYVMICVSHHLSVLPHLYFRLDRLCGFRRDQYL